MRLVPIACGVALATSLVFGGTSRGGLSGMMVGLGALPLVIALFVEPREWSRGRVVLALLALLVATPLLQLAPLPPSLWQALPGRVFIAETYGAAGLDLPWLGISISPHATERVALALLAPAAIFLGALACRREERRLLFALVLLAGAGSALLEFLQVMDGAESPLRFYRPTDGNVGVGVFANRNHAAALLYCAIPLAGVALDPSAGRRPALRLTALAGFYLVVILGLMMTGSRSGLVLGATALALTAAVILRESLVRVMQGRRAAIAVVAGLAAASALLAPAFGLGNILERFSAHEVGAGDRASLARISFEAARSFFPFGSGLGTFDRVFPLFQPREAIAPAIINHAHNDVLELTLEAGLLGLLLIAGTLVLVGVSIRRNRREADAGRRHERDAAAMAIGLLYVHSLLDYPLRMPALGAVFALCAATLAGALDVKRRAEQSAPFEPLDDVAPRASRRRSPRHSEPVA